MNDEKQDLDNLVKHPGWQRFTAYSHDEITKRLDTAIENAANNTSDALVANQLRQCIAVKQAIRLLLAWPGERVKLLREADAKREAVGQMSRRGSL